MTNPQPLKQVSQSALVRELLESAEADRSAVGAAERALSALGIASVTAAGTALTASSSPTAVTNAGAKVLAGKTYALATLKWVGIGFFGGVVAAGSATSVFVKAEPRAATEVLPRTQLARVPVVNAGSSSPPPLVSSEPVADAPTSIGASVPVQPAPSVHGRPASATNERAVFSPPAESTRSATADHSPAVTPNAGAMAQLDALRAIRLSLASHAPARALALLDDFDRRFAAAALAEEAIVLRVEALADAGRAAEAEQLGADFLAKNPNSAYARRVRSKLRFP